MTIMKRTIIWAAVVLAVAAGIFALASKSGNKGVSQNDGSGALNATYTIDGKKVALVDGRAEQEVAPGSASKLITTVFGTPIAGEMDGNGNGDDYGVVLVQDGGGSGTFYYAAIAVNDNGTYRGSNAILLGDRIAPQSSTMKNFVYTVNYADRAPGEPFTTRPSVGASKFLTYDGVSLGEANKKDGLIEVDLPNPGTVVISPLTITGRARGNWFFEASFPLVLTDWDGRIIAQGHATADGDWMTTDYVRFHGTLEFEKPSTGVRGTLILRKDNPSGLPEHDDALEIPVFFE